MERSSKKDKKDKREKKGKKVKADKDTGSSSNTDSDATPKVRRSTKSDKAKVDLPSLQEGLEEEDGFKALRMLQRLKV